MNRTRINKRSEWVGGVEKQTESYQKKKKKGREKVEKYESSKIIWFFFLQFQRKI